MWHQLSPADQERYKITAFLLFVFFLCLAALLSTPHGVAHVIEIVCTLISLPLAVGMLAYAIWKS